MVQLKSDFIYIAQIANMPQGAFCQLYTRVSVASVTKLNLTNHFH